MDEQKRNCGALTHMQHIPLDRQSPILVDPCGGTYRSRCSARDGQQALVEFSWNGDDGGRPKNGNYTTIESDGKLHGRLYIHQGDNRGFVAERSAVRLSGAPDKSTFETRRRG
jgi:hypothetical protein